jgi:hypothetical protein
MGGSDCGLGRVDFSCSTMKPLFESMAPAVAPPPDYQPSPAASETRDMGSPPAGQYSAVFIPVTPARIQADASSREQLGDSWTFLVHAEVASHMVVHVEVNGSPLDAKQRAKVNSVAQRWLLKAADRMPLLPSDALLAVIDDDRRCAFYLVLIPGAAVSIINDQLLAGEATRMTGRQLLERRGGWADSATVTAWLATLVPFMSARISVDLQSVLFGAMESDGRIAARMQSPRLIQFARERLHELPRFPLDKALKRHAKTSASFQAEIDLVLRNWDDQIAEGTAGGQEVRRRALTKIRSQLVMWAKVITLPPTAEQLRLLAGRAELSYDFSQLKSLSDWPLGLPAMDFFEPRRPLPSPVRPDQRDIRQALEERGLPPNTVVAETIMQCFQESVQIILHDWFEQFKHYHRKMMDGIPARAPRPLAIDEQGLKPGPRAVLNAGAMIRQAERGACVTMEQDFPAPPAQNVLNGPLLAKLARDAQAIDDELACMLETGVDYKHPFPMGERKVVLLLVTPAKSLYATYHEHVKRHPGYRLSMALKKMEKMCKLKLWAASNFLIRLPLWNAALGTTTKLEGIRVVHDAGAPHKMHYSIPSGIEVAPMNRQILMIDEWAKRHPQSEHEFPWPRERKPAVLHASRDMAILKHLGDLADMEVIMFSSDFERFFFQIVTNAVTQAMNGFMMPDDAGEIIHFVSGVVLMGVCCSSVIAQSIADVILNIWFERIWEFEPEAQKADHPAVLQWIAQRKRTFGHLKDLPCYNRLGRGQASYRQQLIPLSLGIFTDDNLGMAVGPARAAHAQASWLELCDELNALLSMPKAAGGLVCEWCGPTFIPTLGVVTLPPRKTAKAAYRISRILQGKLTTEEFRSVRAFMGNVAYVLRAFNVSMHLIPSFPVGADPARLIKRSEISPRQVQEFNKWRKVLMAGPAASVLAAFDENVSKLTATTKLTRYCVPIFADAYHDRDTNRFGIGGCVPGALWSMSGEELAGEGFQFKVPQKKANITMFEGLASALTVIIALEYVAPDTNIVLHADATGVPLTFTTFQAPTKSQGSSYAAIKRCLLTDLERRKQVDRVEETVFVRHLIGVKNTLGDAPSRAQTELIASLGRRIGFAFTVIQLTKSHKRFIIEVLRTLLKSGVGEAEAQQDQLHRNGIDLQATSQTAINHAMAQPWRQSVTSRQRSTSLFDATFAAEGAGPALPGAGPGQEVTGADDWGDRALGRAAGILTRTSISETPFVAPWRRLSEQMQTAKQSWLEDLVRQRAETMRSRHAVPEAPPDEDPYLNIIARALLAVGPDVRLLWSNRWKLFCAACKQLDFHPVGLLLTPQEIISADLNIEAVYALLYERIFFAMVPRDKANPTVKPASAYAVVSTMVRIAKCLIVDVMPELTAVRLVQKHLDITYVQVVGPIAALPVKREPILPRLGQRILTVISTKKVWAKHSATVWSAMVSVALQTGFRAAEIAASPARNDLNTQFSWKFVRWNINGETLQDPTVASVEAMVETDSLIIMPPPSKCDPTGSVWTSHAIILYFREDQSINAARAMARLYVESRKADTWSSDTHVFDGITRANMRQQLQTWCRHKQINIPTQRRKYITWHSFRRGLAVALLQISLPVETILRLLRWSSKETLLLYGTDSAQTRNAALAAIQNTAEDPTTMRVGAHSAGWVFDVLHAAVGGSESDDPTQDDNEATMNDVTGEAAVDALQNEPHQSGDRVEAVSAGQIYSVIEEHFAAGDED